MNSKKNFRKQSKGRRATAHDIKSLHEVIQNVSPQADLLIEHLHTIQDSLGYLPERLLFALAEEMNLSAVEVFEVASFYHHFDIVGDQDSPPAAITVRICDSISCAMANSKELARNLQESPLANIRVQTVPCVGRCSEAPIAVVGKKPISTAKLNDVRDAIDSQSTEDSVPEFAIGYAEYLKSDGYKLLQQLQADQSRSLHARILDTLEQTNLRGLGGAGFPLAKKWRIVQHFDAPRLMAVNIDEGEPGTFKDRYYLERDPHRFLEGMLIAATIVGIESIYIYLRDEYAGCRELLQREISILQEHPPCKLPTIHLRRGAGAYICGEESAMIESIEGKRGIPRLRPPYIAERGLFGRPTLEHNMESLYWIRLIIEQGSEVFTSEGRRGRQGFRSFSVSGRIKNPGVHLAPAGITIQELIEEHCGGMLEGHAFKAYFPGGASGGILPASLNNIPLDFDTLEQYGCFIGSAAIIVLSDKDKIRDYALNAMAFFSHESCGQCTPCRSGTEKAVTLMQRTDWDRPLLEQLSQAMQDASICGLGQAAPNPLLCAIKYFPEEL